MNEQMGRTMRFCENCGVGMGIMTREEYVEKYIDGNGVCPYCGKPAVKNEENSNRQMS